MPLCDLHLISLNSTVETFLRTLHAAKIHPIIQARVFRWVILPTSISIAPLLGQNNQWHLFIVLPNGIELPTIATGQITHKWTVTAGVPSRITQGFAERNIKLLHPHPQAVPSPATTDLLHAPSSQDLELSPELESWIAGLSLDVQSHPISMLNLLAFHPGKKEQYMKYGTAFAETIGSRHGGDAKIVGNVISGQGKAEGWDEVAVAHYPSLRHFAGMLGSKDYQDVNHQYRLGALKDTCILCTMEVDVRGELVGKAVQSRI